MSGALNHAVSRHIQGCSEIRWLAEKMGARPETVSGLSGLGDIMLTCYGALSRNRAVGVRLGRGEPLSQIIASSSQARLAALHCPTLRSHPSSPRSWCTCEAQHVQLWYALQPVTAPKLNPLAVPS